MPREVTWLRSANASSTSGKKGVVTVLIGRS